MLPLVLTAQHAPPRRQPVASARDARSDDARVRVKAVAFGDHLTSGAGTLTLVPAVAGTSMDTLRGMLLRSVYGDAVRYNGVDYTNVRILLLPDGDEIEAAGERAAPRRVAAVTQYTRTSYANASHDQVAILSCLACAPAPAAVGPSSADMLCPNDRVVVLVADDRFDGALTSRRDVTAFMEGPTFGLLRYRDDGSQVILPHTRLALATSGADHHRRHHGRSRHARGSRSAHSRVADSRCHQPPFVEAAARPTVLADPLAGSIEAFTPLSASTAASDPLAMASPSGVTSGANGREEGTGSGSLVEASLPSAAAAASDGEVALPGSIAGRPLAPVLSVGAPSVVSDGWTRAWLPPQQHAAAGMGAATALCRADNTCSDIPCQHEPSRRSRSAPASRGPALTPKRRVSGAGNEKLRRVVHRLALIKRFNAAQQAALASAAAKGDLSSANSGSSNSTSSVHSNGSVGSYMSSKASVARWGNRRRLERTMNNYVREQVSRGKHGHRVNQHQLHSMPAPCRHRCWMPLTAEQLIPVWRAASRARGRAPAVVPRPRAFDHEACMGHPDPRPRALQRGHDAHQDRIRHRNA